MKRFFILLTAFIVSINLCKAQELNIHSLHTLSNTMEHSEFLKMALHQYSLTRSITTQQWYEEIGVTSDDTLSMKIMPTLYDLIANDYCARWLPNRDSIIREWQAFHAEDEMSLPSLYVRLDKNGYIQYDTLYAIYESGKNRWESGYVLTKIKDYRNPVLYKYLIDYQKQFPTSPFIPNILHTQRICEQIEVFYSYDSRFRSTDSIVIDYSNTNAHEIIFELYRLSDRLPKKGLVGKAITKVDSVRVTTDSAFVFNQFEMVCKFAPQTYGRYFIYARLPEDTLQKPASMLKVQELNNSTFFVSDLCFFGIHEQQFSKVRPWFIVADANTGQPLQRVKVKYRRALRYTNKNGEAVMRNKWYYARSFSMRKGADKYYYRSYFNAGRGYSVIGKISILPNATIFRPGDTLQLSFIGIKRDKYETALLHDEQIKVNISSYRGFNLDTVLTLNNEGTTSLTLSFTNDMQRGQYTIHAAHINSKDRNESGYCTVRLEDYKLPTFSLVFDDSCRTMHQNNLRPVTGMAMRSNGLPLSGVTVESSIKCYVDRYIVYQDTTITDQEGRFSVQIPERLQQSVKTQWIPNFQITSSIVTPDGERQSETIYVMPTPDKSDTPDISKPEPILIAGVPQDSLLWAPKDSTIINGSEVTMRLGVPRASWVYCAISNRNRLLSHSWKQLTPGMHTYSFTLPNTPDDYLHIHFVTIDPAGNPVEIYRHLDGVAPRQLHITPVSMRDYLTPNAQEHWTFRLTDTQGQPVQGNMVISMTDQALEQLKSSVWRDTIIARWKSPYTAFYQPLFYSRFMQMNSRVPALQNGFRFYPPILYAPYRVDSIQNIVIRGKVVDENGEPVIGAAIQERGTKHGTISDYDGYFHLAVQPNAILEFMYFGMKPVVLPAYNNMYVVMQDNEEVLNEVVVTGYGVADSQPQKVAIRGVRSLKEIPEEEEEEVVFKVVESAVESLGIVEEDSEPEEPTPSSFPLREGDTRLALFLPSLHTDSAGEVQVRFLTPSDNTEWLLQVFAWTQDATSDYLTRSLMARRTLMVRLQLPRFLRHGDSVSIPYTISNAADTTRQTTVTLTFSNAETDTIIYSKTTSISIPAAGSQTLFVPYTALQQADIIVSITVQDTDGTTDGEKRLLRVLSLDEPIHECLPFYLHASDTLVTLNLSIPKEAENKQVQLLLCNDPIAYIASQLPQTIDSSAVTVTQVAHNLYALSLRNKLAEAYPALIQPVDIEFLITELAKYQQIGHGAFRWLKDSRSTESNYLTIRVITLLGELQQMNALSSKLNYPLRKAVNYIDREIVRNEKSYRSAHHDSLPDYTRYAQYAYARVLCDEPQNDDTRRILSATLDSLYSHLSTEELTTWPLLALTFERAGQHDRALAIINGLRRYATIDEAHGMYWNNIPDRYWWYRQADIQASFLLAFSLIDPQSHELEAMRQWLILNNRTIDWGQSSLNAYVSYVLMQNLTPNKQPVLTDPLQQITLPDTTKQYTVRHTPGKPAWGALMASYHAPSNCVQPFATKAMKITRRYERIDTPAATDSVLRKGERIRVTLTITTDREMDQVIITDRRPAALEPVGSSAFVWKDGTFFYREIRNTEERLYIEHIRRGETVISYECYVSLTGTTLAGLASATSELAPEFTTHTASSQLQTTE